VLVILSGLSEQSVHLFVALGMFDMVLHGIIGIKIDTKKRAREAIPAHIKLFFNCMV
jgi:hypothetical protein